MKVVLRLVYAVKSSSTGTALDAAQWNRLGYLADASELRERLDQRRPTARRLGCDDQVR